MTTTKPFGDYAAYYDLLYADKDYETEADFVLSLVTQVLKTKPTTLLDIGCGTGAHARCLASKGINVHGIDLSENMIRLAQNRSPEEITYSVADCKSFDLGKTFDCATALFHVASYQTDNDSLSAMFAKIAKHVRPGGAFLFDFWYGPAVLTDLPENRTKQMENEQLRVIRTASPLLLENDNVVNVRYKVIVQHKDGRPEITTREVHSMRYLFKPELALLLDAAGFDIKGDYQWLCHDKGLSRHSWYGALLTQRRK